jgi:glycosyltransferase involved in cell wall biosynthesis
MRACSIVRVLQAPGALPALVARARYICPFGYSYAAFMDVPFRRFARPARPLKRAAMRAVLRAVLRGATATIVTTSAGSTEARLLGARDVRLIPNGVDVDLFAPHERRDLDVVFVGQLVPRKDVSTLIAAVAKLGSPVRLHVVGDGPERPTLERQAAESGVDAQFVGTRPNSEIAELLGRTRCFVLPSHAEGHPKALLEAMAAGAACIGTAIDAVLEVDGDGALRLVPPGDSTALAIALADVLAGPVTAEELGRRAREVILDRFDLRRLLDMETRLLVDFARAPAANDASQGPLVEASHDGPEARAR